MYSASTGTITYVPKLVKTNRGRLALLHEIGHYILDHRHYKYDMELLDIEMSAWDITRELAKQHSVSVDEVHIANCIATYDAWLTKRATCPTCQNFSLQKSKSTFSCFACGTTWRVNRRLDRRVTRVVVPARAIS